MGLEACCPVTWNGETRTRGVHLDSAVVEVRGRPALRVPFASIHRASVRSGELVLEAEAGTLVLALGEAASAWAAKIVSRPSRARKLGLAAGQRVCIIGVTDAALEAELLAAGADKVTDQAGADVVFYAVAAPRDLERLSALRSRIEPDGAIWVVRTKGKRATVKEADLMSAARAAGLVDIKVVAFSETQSADKLVIPVAERPTSKKQRQPRSLPKKRKTAKPQRAPKVFAPLGALRTWRFKSSGLPAFLFESQPSAS